MTDTPVEYAETTSLRRVVSVLVGVVGGVAYASLIALAFRADGRVPVLCAVLGAVAGGWLGGDLLSRVRIRKFPPQPAIAAGEPVPLGALGRVVSGALEQPTATCVRLAAIVGVSAPAATFGVYVLLGQRPSLFVLGVVAIVGYVAALACTTILPPFLLDERTRTAFAVVDWAGAREFERALGSRHASLTFPVTEEEQRGWLDAAQQAPIRPIDIEVMVMVGELDAARDAVAKLPETTPRERFVKAEHEALVRYQATGEIDRSAMREALSAMPPGPEQIEAAASSAVGEARLLLPDGDWRQPLLAVRAAIPESDSRILLRDHGWVIFTTVLRRHVRWLLLLAGLTIGLGVLQQYLV